MTFAKSLLSIAILLGIAASAQASVTYTSTSTGDDLAPLGVPNTTTYGEVFSVPPDGNSTLDSFSFIIKGDLSRAYAGVAAWTGTGAGPDLYTSEYFTAFFDDFTEVTINTGGLGLTAGQQYVAYFSAYGMENSGTDNMELGNASAVQVGAVWDNAFGGSPNHDDWNQVQGDTTYNFAGSMVFSGADANVPEPGSVALLGLGFAGLAGVRRRKSA